MLANTTLHAIADALETAGVEHVTVEYPGFLKIAISPEMVLTLSDGGETLALFSQDAELTEVNETLESSLPADSTNVEAIADWVYAEIMLAKDVSH